MTHGHGIGIRAIIMEWNVLPYSFPFYLERPNKIKGEGSKKKKKKIGAAAKHNAPRRKSASKLVGGSVPSLL